MQKSIHAIAARALVMLHLTSLLPAPVQAADTDIYATSAASSATRPNIVLLLDNSWSMTAAMAWEEQDPDVYDSHVEYLWNDPRFIARIGCTDSYGVKWNGYEYFVDCGLASNLNAREYYSTLSKHTAERAVFNVAAGNATSQNQKIPAPGSEPSMLLQGYFKGDTLAERHAIKAAAIAFGNARQGSDAGPRHLYRNYSNVAIERTGNEARPYWKVARRSFFLPAGTAQTDPRLSSLSQSYFGDQENMLSPESARVWTDSNYFKHVMRHGKDLGTDYGLWRNNRCQKIFNDIRPSTYWQPNALHKNAGIAKDVRMVIWNEYANQNTTRFSLYPGSDALVQSAFNDPYWKRTINVYQGFLDGARAVSVRHKPFSFTPSGEQTMGLARTDALPPVPVSYVDSGTDSGWEPIGQTGNAVSHWKDLLEHGYQNDNVEALNSITRMHGGSTSATTDSEAFLEVMRTVAPINGTHSYPQTYSIATTGTVTKTRECSMQGGTTWSSASWHPRNVGGTCQQTTADTDCNDTIGSCFCSISDSTTCASVPNPPACSTSTEPNQAVTLQDSTGCTWVGRQYETSESGPRYFGGACTGTRRTFGYAGGSYTTTVASGTSACHINPMDVFSYKDKSGTTHSNASYYGGSYGCEDAYPTTSTCASTFGGTCLMCTNAKEQDSMSTGLSSFTAYPLFLHHRGYLEDSQFDCLDDTDGQAPTARRFGPQAVMKTGVWGGIWGIDNKLDGSNTGYSAPALGASDVPAVDIYHANYLNFRFGARVCRDPSGNIVAEGTSNSICRPLGRKTRLNAAKDALIDVLSKINNVSVGLMVFNAPSGDPGTQTDGAQVAFAVTDIGTKEPSEIAGMTAAQLTANNAKLNLRQALIDKIMAIEATSATPMTEALYEAYRYFRGDAPRYGVSAQATQRDPSAVASTNILINGINVGSGRYISPMYRTLDSGGNISQCQKNVIVLVSDGAPEGDTHADAQVQALARTRNGTTIATRASADTSGRYPPAAGDQIEDQNNPGQPVGPQDGTNYVWADEMAYFMANGDVIAGGGGAFANDQSVRTYTVGFAGANTDLLQSIAKHGQGTNYDARDQNALSAALISTVASLQAWVPVTSYAVPPSLQNRSRTGEDVYISYFMPSPTAYWMGTVKNYQLCRDPNLCGPAYVRMPDGSIGSVTRQTCLKGQNILPTTYWNVESSTVDNSGNLRTEIHGDAASFWMPNTFKDGGSPVRGGVGSVMTDLNSPIAMPNPDSRKVYTLLSGASTSPKLSDNPVNKGNSSITATILGVASADRGKAISFLRGGDPASTVCADTSATSGCDRWRTWSHYAVMHSQPMAVTYSSSRRYLYYVTIDGRLMAVDALTGLEAWSYVIEQGLSRVSDLMANNAVSTPRVIADTIPAVFIHDDNGDGDIVAGDGDKAYLFFGQRRGGSSYYALDITEPNEPRFLWRSIGGLGSAGSGKRCVGVAACGADAQYDEMGETWSDPSVVKIAAKGQDHPVLIIGGGRDPVHDSVLSQTSKMGRAVYVIDGLTGAVIRRFDDSNTTSGMKDSISSKVAALSMLSVASGFADRLYVGDLAGNVYRFDIGDSNPANWKGGKIADLGTSWMLPRRLYFQPVVVREQYKGQAYDAVYVATGDRENPTFAFTLDRVAMIKDLATGPNGDYSSVAKFSDLVDSTNIAATSAVNGLMANEAEFNSRITNATWASKKGWFFELPARERAVGAPAVYDYKLYVPTYRPDMSTNECAPAGLGQMYVVNARTGTALDRIDNQKTSNLRIDAFSDCQGYCQAPRAVVRADGSGWVSGTPNEANRWRETEVSGASTSKVYWYKNREPQ